MVSNRTDTAKGICKDWKYFPISSRLIFSLFLKQLNDCIQMAPMCNRLAQTCLTFGFNRIAFHRIADLLLLRSNGFSC